MAVVPYRYVFLAESTSSSTPLEFEDILKYLRADHENYNKDRQFSVEGSPEYKITYNTASGGVFFSIEKKGDVYTFFDESLKNHFTSMMREAIGIYAKLCLLEKIHELAQQKYPGLEGVEKILHEHHISFDKHSAVASDNITKALSEVCKDLRSKNIVNDAVITAITNLCCVDGVTKIYDDLSSKHRMKL